MDGTLVTENRIGFFFVNNIRDRSNSIEGDVWEAEYKKTVSLIDGVESWDWPCL